MNDLRQCSACGAELSASAGSPPPRRLYFAGREHLLCPAMGCMLVFKRDPEGHAARGRRVLPGGDGPPAGPLPRSRSASPFAVRVAPGAPASEDTRDKG